MKTYLITGGAGFIGSHYLKYVLSKYSDIKIIIADSLTYAGNLETIEQELCDPRVHFSKTDITDAIGISRIFEENSIDFVINFAAESHVDRSIDNPQIFLKTNILGTQNLLEMALKAWRKDNSIAFRPDVKFIQVSTDEVYGSLEREYITPLPLVSNNEILKRLIEKNNIVTYGKKSFCETTPLAPRSPYSASKAGADLIVSAYAETYAMPVNITRCSNNYGPFQFPEKLIPLTINNIIAGRPIPVYGKGENIRDWIYVTDHCRAIDMVLQKGKPGEVYNIGGFAEKQNIDIVKLLIDTCREIISSSKESNINASAITSDLITFVTDRPGHDLRYAIDSSKAMTELGWEPLVSFEEGLFKTVKWYLNSPEWLKNVTSGEYLTYYEKKYGCTRTNK